MKGLACRTFDTSSLKLQTPWKVGIATMILILQVRKLTLCDTKHRVNLEDPLEKAMATHSSTLAWKISWVEELGAGYCPWGCKESGTTERLHFHTARCPHEGHLRNPFQEWNCLWPRGSELGLWDKLPWASVSSSGKWGWWWWCCQYQQRFTELIH